MLWFDILILILAGIACGFFTSMFGWGGGLTVVPALLIYFPLVGVNLAMAVHLAFGTCFLVMLITNFVSTYKSHRSGHVMWDIFLLLLPLTIFGMIVGGFVEKVLPASMNIIILICITIYAFIRFVQKLMAHKKAMQQPKEININKKKFAAFGFFVGLLSSCTGGGSSLMLSPVLKHANLSMKQTIGVITAMNMLVAIMGIVVFAIIGFHVTTLPAYSVGYINLPAAIILVLSSFIGVPIGHKVAKWLTEIQYTILYVLSLFAILIILLVKLI
ncbi:sulfite exporter TauE/SafE family protein [Facilibium subflavum]|uniref:sulfite exporter TauE/SafE family protein n=1 Tax=Facilibium subflavum TaxID=2219058 RepID=UPI000E657F31|nr:sulfite exporter TauE/SafE family protein [Facilibium subflavum]